MGFFTDEEHRIILSALELERKVCEKIDGSKTKGEVKLTDICNSITRKIRDLQNEKSNDLQGLNKVSIRLVKDAPILSEHPIKTPEEAVALLGDEMSQLAQEHVCVINLKSDCTPINCSIVSIGTVNRSLAQPAEVFKTTLLSNASTIILLHNHPSGDITPSIADDIITKKIMMSATLLGLECVDHVIVGAGNNKSYYSYNKNNRIDYIKNEVNRHVNEALYNKDISNVAEQTKECFRGMERG